MKRNPREVLGAKPTENPPAVRNSNLMVKQVDRT